MEMQDSQMIFGGGMMIFTIIIVAVSVIVPLGITGAVFWFIFKKRAETQQLVATGVAGQAMVVQMGDTGMRINNQPQLALTLDVHPIPGQSAFAPFRTTHNAIVPMMAMARVAPGAALPVKCDPANPARLTVDWRAMGYAV